MKELTKENVTVNELRRLVGMDDCIPGNVLVSAKPNILNLMPPEMKAAYDALPEGK